MYNVFGVLLGHEQLLLSILPDTELMFLIDALELSL